MISKNKIKHLRQFQYKKYRDEHSVFFIEGSKMVQQALSSSCEVLDVVATEQWIFCNKHLLSHVRVHVAEQADISKISQLKHPSDVWALLAQNSKVEKCMESISGLVLALDEIQDPGNMGTIMRIADWFGVQGILASYNTVDCYNPKVVQASMGAVFRVPVCYVDLPTTLSTLSLPVLGAGLEGNNVFAENLPNNFVLVMGNEGKGISLPVAKHIQSFVHIPGINTGMESLNVGVATGILCAEYARQSMNR